MNQFFKFPRFIIICLIFTASIITIGINLLPLEADPPDFKFQFVEIYEKFFEKQAKQEGVVYVAQRERAHAAEFPVFKNKDIVRIFIIGGSVGYNFGYFDFANYLKQIIPGKNFQIINCGVGVYDSYRETLVIKEILLYKPDLVVLFSGNNEFRLKPWVNLPAYYINKHLRQFKYYRYLQESLSNTPFFRNKISCYRSHEEIIKDFTSNIQRSVKLVKSKGVPFIICTLPINFRDCAPGGRRPADSQFLQSIFLLEKGKYKEAINNLEWYLDRCPQDTFGLYFLASAYEASGDYAKAKQLYLQSVEADFGRGRTLPSLNAIIRQISVDQKIGLADLENAFMDTCEHGLIGKNQFYDHCHWHFAYNQLVAESIIKVILQKPGVYAKIVSASRPVKVPALSSFSPPSLSSIVQLEGRIDERIRNAASEVYILNSSFSNASFISERAISFLKMLYEIDPKIIWNIQYQRGQIENALLNNVWTKENIVKFGIDSKWPRLLTHIGETYRRLGNYERAFLLTDEAISLNKTDHLPYLVRAFTYYQIGDLAKARQSLNDAKTICAQDPEVLSFENILSAKRLP